MVLFDSYHDRYDREKIDRNRREGSLSISKLLQDGASGILVPYELYDPERSQPIVTPDRIPIHPLVYQSHDIYTPEFCTELLKGLDLSIESDLRGIRDRLGLKLNFKPHGAVSFTVDPEERIARFEYENTEMVISPEGEYTRLLTSREQLPQTFPERRIMDFSMKKNGLSVPASYAPQLKTPFNPQLALPLRSVAIQFNNLGIINLVKTRY